MDESHFADCQHPEDKKWVSLFQALLKGEKDISVFDDESRLTLAADVPKSILNATGKSGVSFSQSNYYWHFYDIHFLLNNQQPTYAVPISEAGFSESDLADLAKPDHCLEYVRLLEEYSGNPKGHYFPVELEKKMIEIERRHNAKARLHEKLRTLRNPMTKSTKNLSPQVPKKLKNIVLQFHNYTCIFDGQTRPDFPIHVHHIIPVRQIEKLSLPVYLFTARENLVACCEGCNIAKSDELSKPDIRFYLLQFNKPDHPNYPLIPLLKQIEQLQVGKRHET
jgi:5-methylcytosine-specific restriction endonuclease McrA